MAVDARELGNQLPHFFFGEDSRQAVGSLGPCQFKGQIQTRVQYVLAWEQQRAEGLVLCRSSHVFLCCQVGE